MEIINWIDTIDKIISVLIHNDSDQKILDQYLPTIREAYFSLPVYILVIIWILINDKFKIWKFLFFSVLLICLTDFISAAILKPLFQRPRPLYDPFFNNFFREIVSKGGLYSFPSSHASNHFGLAFLWCSAFKIIYHKNIYWPLIWASLICYAQIYVGKHYLTDIIAGALLGYTMSKLIIFTYLKFETNSKYFSKIIYKKRLEI